jgi:hypothetical protein
MDRLFAETGLLGGMVNDKGSGYSGIFAFYQDTVNFDLMPITAPERNE